MLHGRTIPEGRTKPIPSYSSGERGLGGEALLLEKRPLPPAVPPPASSEGGPGEGLLAEKPPPPEFPFSLIRHFQPVTQLVDGFDAGSADLAAQTLNVNVYGARFAYALIAPSGAQELLAGKRRIRGLHQRL